MSIYWLIFGIILLFLEIVTTTFFSSLLGFCAIFVGIISYFWNISEVLQIILFCILAILCLVFLRPFLLQFFMKTDRKSNVNSLIGMNAYVESEITKNNKGYIKVYSDRLPAIAIDGKTIEEGKKVKILKIDGITAVVEKVNK